MEKKKKKKTWTEPKLTALVRRKPEEGILRDCKHDRARYGPGADHSACMEGKWCEGCYASGFT